MQCGCSKLLDARERDAPPEIRAREESAARALCKRWNCGTGTPTEDRLLKSVAKSFASFAGVSPEDAPTSCQDSCSLSCPFEGVFRGDGWVQELQAARVLVQDEHLTWGDALGRDLTAVDRDALLVLKRAENKLDRLRREQDEAERKRKELERQNGAR